MDNYELDRKAKELSDKFSAYTLAKMYLSLKEEQDKKK